MTEEKEKRYYWLKLKEDFFEETLLKLLRKLPDGDAVAIVYLKLLLKALKNNGKIFIDGLLPDQSEEIAIWLDEDVNIVKMTIEALKRYNVVETVDSETLYINTIELMLGSECYSAKRVREHRDRKKEVLQSNKVVTISNQEKREELELDKREELDKNKVYVEKIKDLFNGTCSNLSKIKSLSKKRISHIKQRENTLKDFNVDWEEYFVIVNNSQFLIGKNKTKWKANFDWLINEGNMMKVLEGNYNQKSGFESQMDTINDWVNEKEEYNA